MLEYTRFGLRDRPDRGTSNDLLWETEHKEEQFYYASVNLILIKVRRLSAGYSIFELSL
jgi:hypothetical protein